MAVYYTRIFIPSVETHDFLYLNLIRLIRVLFKDFFRAPIKKQPNNQLFFLISF